MLGSTNIWGQQIIGVQNVGAQFLGGGRTGTECERYGTARTHFGLLIFFLNHYFDEINIKAKCMFIVFPKNVAKKHSHAPT